MGIITHKVRHRTKKNAMIIRIVNPDGPFPPDWAVEGLRVCVSRPASLAAPLLRLLVHPFHLEAQERSDSRDRLLEKTFLLLIIALESVRA